MTQHNEISYLSIYMQITCAKCCRRSDTLYLTHDITALNTCSSERTFSSSLEIISTNWPTGKSKNSSLSITSWKLCCVNLSAIRRSSRHEWVSAKARIPKQFEGSSCLFKNSQHMSWISANCRRQAVNKNSQTCYQFTIKCLTNLQPNNIQLTVSQLQS